MSALKWAGSKDPDEIEDFVVDWTARLAPGDTIATSTWPNPPSGITIVTNSFSNNASLWNGTTTLLNRYYSTIWLSSGVLGQTYLFTNRITTTGGRTYDQSVKLKVKTR